MPDSYGSKVFGGINALRVPPVQISRPCFHWRPYNYFWFCIPRFKPVLGIQWLWRPFIKGLQNQKAGLNIDILCPLMACHFSLQKLWASFPTWKFNINIFPKWQHWERILLHVVLAKYPWVGKKKSRWRYSPVVLRLYLQGLLYEEMLSAWHSLSFLNRAPRCLAIINLISPSKSRKILVLLRLAANIFGSICGTRRRAMRHVNSRS